MGLKHGRGSRNTKVDGEGCVNRRREVPKYARHKGYGEGSDLLTLSLYTQIGVFYCIRNVKVVFVHYRI